jgi:hypothetical protein
MGELREMNHEDKKKALEAIVSLESGGNWSRRAARRLRRILEKNPIEFWQAYLEIKHPPSTEARLLINSGAITEESTFADLRAVMESNPNQGEDAE